MSTRALGAVVTALAAVDDGSSAAWTVGSGRTDMAASKAAAMDRMRGRRNTAHLLGLRGAEISGGRRGWAGLRCRGFGRVGAVPIAEADVFGVMPDGMCLVWPWPPTVGGSRVGRVHGRVATDVEASGVTGAWGRRGADAHSGSRWPAQVAVKTRWPFTVRTTLRLNRSTS